MSARLERTPHSKPFEMPTSTRRKPRYRQYGILSFSLQGKQFSVPVYINLELQDKPGFERHLFLPFTDLTNGLTATAVGVTSTSKFQQVRS